MKNFERYSLLIINSFFCLISGFCKNTGTTLEEFGKIYHVNIVDLSKAMAIRAVGSCLGSAFAGYSLDKWNRQLQLSLGVFLTGLSTIFLPLCLNIKNFFVLITLQSFLLPLDTIVPSVWTAELFAEKSSFYLLLIDFFSSLGEILTPLFLGLFLSEKISEQTNLSSFVSFINESSEESRLWIPFLVFGSLQILCSLLFFIAYLIKPYKKPKKTLVKTENVEEDENLDEEDTRSKKNIILNENKSNEEDYEKKFSKSYIVFFSTMICFLVSLQMGNELNCLNFLPTYLHKSSLDLNPKQAAYVITILSITKAIGRLLTSFLILKVNIKFMIFLNLGIVFLGNLLLVTFGIKTITMAWLSLAIIGFGLSSTFPLVFCFVQKNVSLKSRYVSIYTVAICLYLSMSSFLVGYLIEKTPNYFIYYNLFTILLMVLIFFSLVILTKFPKKFQKQNLEAS